jgi:hypothetical protein
VVPTYKKFIMVHGKHSGTSTFTQKVIWSGHQFVVCAKLRVKMAKLLIKNLITENTEIYRILTLFYIIS